MSDSFIHELILQTNPYEKKVLNIRLEMARILYNTILLEGFKRLKLIKESKIFQKAKKSKDFKHYNEVNKLYKFSDYDFQSFAIKTKNSCMIKDHLDAHVCQKVATRAYQAVDKYRKGKMGKPRFKGKNRFLSIEGKSNITGIRFKNKKLYYKGLIINPIFDKKDIYGIEKHALSSKVKYCRLIKKVIKNKEVWILQLVLEGKPKTKNKNKSQDETVGLDIGPSTIAIFQDKKATLTAFCFSLKPLHLKQKKLQRKLDRSLRATNPSNYNADKTIKKNIFWKKSRKYKKNQNKLFEVFRKLKTSRKRLHGNLANKIIKLGNIIKTEKLSYKSFQKRYGKSIGFRAPGLFLQILNRKAENAGGFIEEINTKSTCLSQICHNCLKKEKKLLSQRWHKCNCGIKAVQRDLYSAYLARHVMENKLDINQCKKDWSSASLLLEQAMSNLKKTTIGKQKLASFGLS